MIADPFSLQISVLIIQVSVLQVTNPFLGLTTVETDKFLQHHSIEDSDGAVIHFILFLVDDPERKIKMG